MAKARQDPLNNPRSRAARRATSPSLNTDKSLKEAPRASDATPGLAPYRGAGIQKKTKKKQLSHSQRVRHERVLAKGEAVQDVLDSKLADAQSRLKRRQSRRAMWEDVNTTSNEEVRKAIKAPGRFSTLDDEDDELKVDVQPFHGDTEIKVIGGVQVPAFATGESLNVAVAPTMMTSTKKPGTFGVQSKQPEPVKVTDPNVIESTESDRVKPTEPETLMQPLSTTPTKAEPVDEIT